MTVIIITIIIVITTLSMVVVIFFGLIYDRIVSLEVEACCGHAYVAVVAKIETRIATFGHIRNRWVQATGCGRIGTRSSILCIVVVEFFA